MVQSLWRRVWRFLIELSMLLLFTLIQKNSEKNKYYKNREIKPNCTSLLSFKKLYQVFIAAYQITQNFSGLKQKTFIIPKFLLFRNSGTTSLSGSGSGPLQKQQEWLHPGLQSFVALARAESFISKMVYPYGQQKKSSFHHNADLFIRCLTILIPGNSPSQRAI